MKYTISNNDTTVLSRQPAMHERMLSRQLKALGSKGGKARAIKLTPDQRKEIAIKAANTRWQKGEEFSNGLRST
jgi:DNA-binding HxlR family transcriptional regulator